MTTIFVLDCERIVGNEAFGKDLLVALAGLLRLVEVVGEVGPVSFTLFIQVTLTEPALSLVECAALC